MKVLTKALKDEDTKIRLQAIDILEDCGAEAEPTIPILKELANSSDPELRCEAAETLEAITSRMKLAGSGGTSSSVKQ
jgi:HEAT repeat protein